MHRHPAHRLFLTLPTLASVAFITFVMPATESTAQDDEPESLKIVIADEPKTIDPATLLPEALAAPVIVEFDETSLKDVVEWLKSERQISILLDNKALSDANILVSEPVTDRLNDEPLYLLLDRLQTLDLAWYMQGGILHLTTTRVAQQHLSTIPYNLGDLLDAGYKADHLTRTVQAVTGGEWQAQGEKQSRIVLLGDVLFVRQTDEIHREVAGLLAALREHGRRTFTLDPPQNEVLREKLNQNVSVEFQETPLSTAIDELAEQAGIDIWLDKAALRSRRLPERTPVSLTLAEQKLSTVLQSLLVDLELTWVIRDGILWVTTHQQAGQFTKAAVYDVRDLCRDENESFALQRAIIGQTAGPWQGSGQGNGVISFAKPGAMVVRQTERGLNEVLQLLETYRIAIKASKPRDRDEADAKKVTTQFYRMPKVMADDLAPMLPLMVQNETWKNEERPDAIGTILIFASSPGILDAAGLDVEETDGEGTQHGLVVPYTTLMITQTREVHEKISELIIQIENGDEIPMGSGMGGMGGSFGGGFFSVP